jgi:type I restriction-modification system DNA methylase subunit
MSLFQKTVLKKHLLEANTPEVDAAYKRFSAYFHDATRQQNIRNSKEEQFQEGFLRELFGHIFGYTLNPEPNFNLTTELKNTSNSKKVDGAIVFDGKAIAVIELKGTNTTDLNSIETQAFGYKSNQPECVYVITSNFEKLRFYIDNSIDYEEFNLFTLNREQFNLLYLCLNLQSIQQHLPKRLKDESVSQEDAITKKLYKDYSEFKRALYQNLVELNPDYDKLLLFKKTQKLLDRFLFIFFAEDRLLLPTNLIFRINQEWKNLKQMRIPVSLYERYITYFNDLNVGAKVTLPAFGKKTGDAITAEFEIFAYNGGLFVPDEVLDHVKIDDEVLHVYTEKMSHYDFDSDVDVNILGHIFENSLNEIDEIKSEIEGETVDKTKTRRKKDGVFYTPKYITKYIVDNTVGKLCAEKKAELNLVDEDYTNDKKIQTKTKKAHLDKLTDYRTWLLQLTICDPACGSGAFLNQALEFLIAEHRYVDELQAKLMGDSLILSDVENSILENNIYGVDLNDESVEIAKLSLWLRTAQKGRKLNSLNNNIKCGNSLIDDPEVAGDKAFSWEKEFPSVFPPLEGDEGGGRSQKRGFDVVIGNPPYVQLSKLSSTSDSEKKYLLERYSTSGGRLNTYIFFIHLIEIILKKDGLSSYIIPNTILTQEYYSETRKLILEKLNLYQIVNYPVMPFSDAVVDSVTLFMRKSNLINEIGVFNQEPHLTSLQRHIQKETLENNYNYNFEVNGDQVTAKIESLNLQNLGDLLEINQAIALKGDKTLSVKSTFDNGLLKLIDGKHINRFQINWGGDFLDYDVDKIHSCKRRDIFESPEKLFFRRVSSTLVFSYDNEQYFALNTLIVLNSKIDCPYSLKALLGILNSKLMNHFYVNKYKSTKKVFSEIQASTVKLLPIAQISNQNDFIKNVDLIINLNKELREIITKFLTLMKSDFSLDKFSKKLEDFYILTWGEFEKELNKNKITLLGVQKDDWFDRFDRFKKQALELKTQIDQTDKEIDKMVYELYGLTEEEIKIVEGS